MSAWEIKVTGKVVGAVVEGKINPSNTMHHRVQSSFQVLKDALHIALSISIMRSGDIMRIISHNPRERIRQTTQGKIWHKSAGVSHKSVVAVQWATTGSYCTRVMLSAAPKKTQFSQTPLWVHRNNTSVYTVMEVTWTTPWSSPWIYFL